MTTLGDNENLIRCLKLNREKGASSWLTVLPLQDQGYSLNKQEFKDAICLRYGWKISNTPLFCGCGKKNDVNHSLICAKGGYAYMRHNALRDLNADLLQEASRPWRFFVLYSKLAPSTYTATPELYGERLNDKNINEYVSL